MADYRAPFRLQDTMLWPELHAAEILEESGLKYCIVGDVVVKILGFPLVISDLYLAVQDEQLKAARSFLIMHNFNEVPQTHERFFDKKATKESQIGWPGHRLVNIEAHPQRAGVMLVPATYWHLDLGPACFATNIFLHPDICCQFPKRLFYLDDLYTPS